MFGAIIFGENIFGEQMFGWFFIKSPKISVNKFFFQNECDEGNIALDVGYDE